MSFGQVLAISFSLPFMMLQTAHAQDTQAPAIPTPVVTAAAKATKAATPVDPENAPVTRKELPDLVKEVLFNNPEIIMQAAQKMRDKQMADAQKTAQEGIEKNKEALYNNPATPSIGNAKADITVAQFFDYHCGYCKKLLPTIVKLLAEDKNLRVVFHEYPILSEDSVAASRSALAVFRIAKDKYFDYHIALMKHDGKYDEEAIMQVAKKVGVNTDKLKTEMAKQEVTDALEKARGLAETLGVRGTPAIALGNKLIPGAIGYDDLKKEVDELRSSNKK